MSIEVMKQALEALEVLLRDYGAVHDAGDLEMQPAFHQAHVAVEKLRQAIAEAEDKWEPRIFRQYSFSGDLISIKIQRTKDGELEVIHPCVDETPKCKDDPRAPQGFDRNASHNADRYVCECEGWEPPEIEPVAWWDKDENRSDEAFRFQPTQNHTQPLYTVPKREWVGLTKEEMVGLMELDGASLADFVRYIEAKLKEKNCGSKD